MVFRSCRPNGYIEQESLNCKFDPELKSLHVNCGTVVFGPNQKQVLSAITGFCVNVYQLCGNIF